MQIEPAPVSYDRKPRVDETDHPVALARLRTLAKVDDLRAKGASLGLALDAVELSKSTYYDWRRRDFARGYARRWRYGERAPGELVHSATLA